MRKRTTGPEILIKTCAVSESILSHKKLLVSHKYGFIIIHCVVSPVCVKHPLDFQNKNNACCSIIIGVLPLEIAIRSFKNFSHSLEL